MCVFKVTGNQTVTAQFKSLVLTRFFFSGLNPWQLTVDAPASLGLTSVNPPVAGRIRAAYGSPSALVNAVPFQRCMAGVPEVRCVKVLNPDNTTITMEIFPPDGTPNNTALAPLAFLAWSGACTGASTVAAPFVHPTCTFTSGSDQTVILKWQYYQCANGPNDGFGGWIYKQDPLRPDGCVLKP